MNTQAKMTKYLEDKYGKEFVVENVRREGQGLGVEGNMVGDATSKGEEIHFRVIEGSSSEYHDTYVNESWSKEASSDLDKYIQSVGLAPVKSYAEVGTGRQLRDTLNRVPSLGDILRTNGKDISYNVATIFEGEQVTDQDKANLQKLIEYVRSKNPSDYGARYVINSKKENNYWLCQYYGGIGNQAVRGSLTEEEYISKCFRQASGRE